MGVPIDRDLLENPDAPSFEVINYAISQQRKDIRRLDKLFNYYNGEQLDRRKLKQKQAQETKVIVNNAKYTTDMVVGFTTGNPISISAGRDKNIDAVMDVLTEMDINSHDAELEKDLSVFGSAYELIYLSVDDDGKTTHERIEKIDPRGVAVVTDDTVEKTPLFAVHYQKKFNLRGTSNGWLITVYTPHWIYKYRTKNSPTLEVGNLMSQELPKRHYFGDVPIIEYRNNEERQGDFEQTISLMDAYNLLQSDRISDKENFIDALLVLYGFKLSDAANLKDGVLEAPGKGSIDNGGGDVEWLTKSFNENDIEVLAKSIRDDIHMTTYVPNMTDENFMGNVSGEAMKYKLFGLIQLLATKQRYLTRGIRCRLKLLENILTVKGQQVDVSAAHIQIVPNIPVNLTDVVTNIKNASGVIPEKVTLGWLPGNDSPDDLIKMLNVERKEAADRMSKAAGSMSTSNFDEENGDNDDSGSISSSKRPD